MSLWTPSGEHPVGDERPTQGAGQATGGSGAPRDGGPPDGGGADGGGAGGGLPGGGLPGGGGAEDPLEPGGAADVEELRRRLAEAPAEVVVANHCYGLFELAALYLSDSPPHLSQSRLAIDALGSVVDGLGERLGEAYPSLRDALAQIRLAFVQISAAEEAGGHQDGPGNGHGAAAATS